jgi:hypothetical protein
VWVLDFALLPRTAPLRPPAQRATVANELLQRIALSEYPYLVEMLTQQALPPGGDSAQEHVFGLDLILDAAERLRDAANPDMRSTQELW